jgi:hypothetical protein
MRTRRIGGKPVFRQIAVLGLAIHCFVFSLPPRSAAENAPSSHAAADSELLAENPPGDPQLLPPVVVTAENLPLTGSGTTINREIIEKLPLRNNSINEALTILPGIQFGEAANISTQGGEILPPPVSISGGKTFENNFTIDGISNNSLLDPAADDPLAINEVPGHAQELFLDASLVEGITVYDSNVPARFGGFKGGVVDAETISPNPRFGGKLIYRTTRDEWTSFHIDEEKEEDFYNSTDHKEQPKFRKHHFGFDLHVPISPRLLTVGAYRQLYSRIPLKQGDETKTQERQGENYLFKTVFQATERTDYEFLWTYTPYRGTYSKDGDGFRDSDFTLYGGGHLFSASCHTELPLAALGLQVAYSTSENSRQAPTDITEIEITQNVWDKEGFLGDIENNQKSFQLKTDLAFLPFAVGPTSHALNAGFDIQHIEGTSERLDTSYLYKYLLNDSASTADDYPIRKVYEQSSAEAVLRLYGIYIEDIITLSRLELRPGLRLDYDDFMQNLNLAPRLAAAVDIFGNRRTLLIAGYNRYYARTLLAYKLRAGIKPAYQEQLIADEWTFYKGTTTDTRYSELKTPYADEYVLGLEQQLFGGKAAAKYIRREGRDEFANTFEREEDGIFYNTLNNNGRSRHESYRISWERQWRNHYLSLNGTYVESTTSNESYDELLNEEDLEDQVWYDGHALKKTDLPRKDFNRPWVVNLVYVGKFPYGFTFSSLAKYRSGYRALEKTGEKPILVDGEPLPVYDEVKKGGGVILSCKIDWEKRLWLEHSMVLSLEANNLLNKKTSVGNTDDYEIGRQVWAGLEYHF